MRDPSPDDLRLEEERGIASALFFVISEAPTRWPGWEEIRAVHRLIFCRTHPMMAGEYRRDIYEPQYIRHSVPRPGDVPACMIRLGELMIRAKSECDGLDGEERDEKAVEWTARIHHRLERIHPFEDGNGRTGRAIAVWMLLHYDLPAFDVTPETRTEYLDALDAADKGLRTDDLLFADVWPHQTEALQPLIDFIWASLDKEVHEAEDNGHDSSGPA